jgi:hypothetical protein
MTAESTHVAPAWTSGLGFVVDIVGSGGHDRLSALVGRVAADLGIPAGETKSDDSTAVFLPAGPATAHVLPCLISAMTERLARDNQRHGARMRLRMAVGAGDPVEDLRRLAGSAVLREAFETDEHSNLALLLTPALHDEGVRAGDLDEQDFTEVEVAASEFAWLRLC